jgi:predicted NAD-dependent protein-ADP-ribosyltransferase YbiA (DUF1768 family)
MIKLEAIFKESDFAVNDLAFKVIFYENQILASYYEKEAPAYRAIIGITCEEDGIKVIVRLNSMMNTPLYGDFISKVLEQKGEWALKYVDIINAVLSKVMKILQTHPLSRLALVTGTEVVIEENEVVDYYLYAKTQAG